MCDPRAPDSSRRSRDVPSGDLKTDARGLTSEMKFIIALSGSFSCDLLPSAAGEASDPEGSLLVKANRAIFLVAFRGPCLPARARTVRAGERQRTVAGFMLVQTSSTCIERRSCRCRLFVWGAPCVCPSGPPASKDIEKRTAFPRR